ncbi:MAG: alpha-galactosidase [Candidatus Limivivens sp.]|nr:alpha-galactosidase [Candidatus Limivivens sp.]
MAIQQIDNRLFALQTKHTSYIFQIEEGGLVETLYWGKRIRNPEDFAEDTAASHVDLIFGPQRFREECSSFGDLRFRETSLKVSFSDGTRDFRYQVSKIQTDGRHLELVLQDIRYPFAVHLHYEVFEEEDIIKKWRTAENSGEDSIVLERFYSGEFSLPGKGYETWNFDSRWAAEFQAYSEPLETGKKVYESLYGLTGHNAGPFFLVHKDASETGGETWFGALEYSGNFKTVLETVNSGYLNILIGMSDTDFSWTLEKGECLETPAVYAGYADGGFEQMSHRLHSFCFRHLMPSAMAQKPLPVLYNSWYSTLFDVKVSEQAALAEKAASLGVELFVVDDGWFEGRKDDTAALGDWFADKEKFPNGLTGLIEEVNRLGMKFGLWIEPEMTNQNSRLYAAHPEWIYRYDTREVRMGRNQYELDMSNPEVVDYLIDLFDRLLKENNIEYIKWDMNRYAAEMGSRALEPSKWKELWLRNTQGVYRLIRELRRRHPQVEFEACASGGGRVDYGAMRYFDEYWPSDNSDPLDRLFIQENYSYFYPVKYMRAWLTEDYGMNQRKIPLPFAMHVSMCGSLGIGMDLNTASEETMEAIRHSITVYKEIRDLVQFGRVYRLKSLSRDEIHAVQYVKENRSVVFVFLDHERYGNRHHHLLLRGLKEEKRYRLEYNGKEEVKTGDYLMQMGLFVELKGDYDSILLQLEEL